MRIRTFALLAGTGFLLSVVAAPVGAHHAFAAEFDFEKPVTLKGTPNHPNALATIYFDTESNEAYLMVNNMPAAPSDKQYQLWAIIDGKPVDAGVFNSSGDTSRLQKMGRFENAQAFAVTVERVGGSPTPSMETMVVIGSI